WALFCMTAPRPEGPYSKPEPLLAPQLDKFLPPLAEFYPAFLHDGRIHAPATSVAANRTFQSIFSAALEEAHRPEVWTVEQYGSVWHAEPEPAEVYGLWGQTISGQVGPEGILRACYFCKDGADRGTVSLARRPWNTPYRDGFVLSAPN